MPHDPRPPATLESSADGSAPGAGSAATESAKRASEEIDRLYRENNAALLRFIATKLGSTQEAKEVVQEAYVRLLGLSNRAAVSYLRAFLFKTAANLATDRLRERTRRGHLMDLANAELPVFELSPERQIDGEQALQRLHDAIAELPVKCREVFLLYRLEGLRAQEIAIRVGIQERMVWLYIARALEYLRGRVEGPTPPTSPRARP
jgi:RNA polymerase sigma factor (sigma-70 family)